MSLLLSHSPESSCQKKLLEEAPSPAPPPSTPPIFPPTPSLPRAAPPVKLYQSAPLMMLPLFRKLPPHLFSDLSIIIGCTSA